jgi:hypothetical protein
VKGQDEYAERNCCEEFSEDKGRAIRLWGRVVAIAAVTVAVVETGTPASGARGTHSSVQPTAEQLVTWLVTGDSPIIAYNAQTDPNQLLGRQGEYTSKVNWGQYQDSSIEVFASGDDASARNDYLSGFSSGLLGDGYDHQSGAALLRLSRSYTPSQAHAIEAQFDRAELAAGR